MFFNINIEFQFLIFNKNAILLQSLIKTISLLHKSFCLFSSFFKLLNLSFKRKT